jgi:hypothetical protein
MLGSITPLGERGRGALWGLTATAYIMASTVSGTVVGGLLGLAGSPTDRLAAPARLGLIAAAILSGLVLDLGLFGLRLPTVHRQVNDEWMYRYRGWVYGAAFGAQLGVGAATVVTTSATYAALLVAFLSASPATGAAIGLVFGLVRALAVLLVAQVREPHQLGRVHRALERLDPASRSLTLAAQSALALGAVALTLVASR